MIKTPAVEFISAPVMDDSSGWIHGNGGYAGSCIPGSFQYCSELEQQQHDELLICSEIQGHLNQISMEMNMEDDEPAAAYSMQRRSSVVDGCRSFPSSSSSASLSNNPEISSTTEAAGLQFPVVSSSLLAAPGGGGVVLLPYDDTPAGTAPAGGGKSSSSTSSFRRYERCHFGPQRRRRLTKPASGGQRMFKTAMSVLAKMHTAMRYYQQEQQYYQQQEPSVNQLQNVISERKRRVKLNDSFRALKTVLPPPGSKKLHKTSILIIARDYVNSLKSKLSELEEKNQALRSELARRATSAAEEDGAGEKHDVLTSAGANEC